MTEDILNLDTELFIYLNSLGFPLFDNFWIFLSNKEANVLFYSTLLVLYFYKRSLKFKFSELFYLLILIAFMITITDQTANLFKDSFQRLRPCYNEMIKDSIRLVKESCGGKYGFFSAHAANSAAVTSYILFNFKSYRKSIVSILLFFWVGLFSYSRIYLGKHYPLDIFFGLIFGISAGFMFSRLFLNLRFFETK